MSNEMTSAGFWQSEQCLVMVNPRDPGAVAEAGIIRPWLEQQPALSGHMLFATSGSSGGRKWVVLSRQALLASAAMVNRHLSAATSDRWLMALPDFHVGGMGIFARSYDAGCGLLRMEGKWNPGVYHDMADAEKITLSSLVPTQLFDLVQRGFKAPDSLRALLIGGGRLADDLYVRAVGLGWPVMETYGMTEAASQIATTMSGHRDLKILPGWQTKLTQEGNLSIKGDSLLSAYVCCTGDSCLLNDPLVDGWFDTGDRVAMTADTIKVRGRADRCVKVLGELINLSEIEGRVLQHAARCQSLSQSPSPIPELAVVAVPDSRKGNRLVLCADQQTDVDQIRKHYNQECHPVERIDELCCLGEIPRSPMGKVLYGALSEAVVEQRVAEGWRK